MNKKWMFPAGIPALSWFHVAAAMALSAAVENIELDNLSVDKCVAGAFVGNLSVSNAPGGQYTFTVDDNRFVVDGSRLSLKSATVDPGEEYVYSSGVNDCGTAQGIAGFSIRWCQGLCPAGTVRADKLALLFLSKCHSSVTLKNAVGNCPIEISC